MESVLKILVYLPFTRLMQLLAWEFKSPRKMEIIHYKKMALYFISKLPRRNFHWCLHYTYYATNIKYTGEFTVPQLLFTSDEATHEAKKPRPCIYRKV